jgi:hydantoinase/carbamoylase family amidase
LISRLERLRAIGASVHGGVTRPAFSPADVRARHLATDFMRQAGLRPRVDAAANLIGSAPGHQSGLGTLLLGSHLDTVPNGGAFDGVYGVLAAIEVFQSLRDHRVTLDHPAAAIAFSNEEGTPGTLPMFGSRAVAGMLERGESDRRDAAGHVLGNLLADAGGDPTRLDMARWPVGSIAAFLELHIEQGPVLDRAQTPIGVVEAISGRQTVAVTVAGTASHGGTTPMANRRDALVAAAQIVLGVRDLGGPSGVTRVATVGECVVLPGAWNVVPGEVRLIVDLRDIRSEAIERGIDRLRALADRVGADSGTTVTVTPAQRVEPVWCDPRLRSLVANVADELDLAHQPLPSGAGHDAQWVSCVAPSAMIFVPSTRGISHTPEEHSSPADLIAGADVLLNSVLAMDRALRPHATDRTASHATG